MNYLVSILEIKNLDNSKFPDSSPKSTVKCTLKANSKLAKAIICYVQLLTSDASELKVSEIIELEKDQFELSIKETPNGNITILRIV